MSLNQLNDNLLAHKQLVLLDQHSLIEQSIELYVTAILKLGLT